MPDSSRMNDMQLFASLARRVDLDPSLFERPGTTVVGHETRAGTSSVGCYAVRSHRLVWADPAIVEPLHVLAGPDPRSLDELVACLEPLGLPLNGSGLLRLLDTDPPPLPSLIDGYEARTLDVTDPATVPVIKAFTERCDPEDVDEADLLDLDDFDDAAIRVVLFDGEVVAFAGGAAWSWDPAFADIGVLVHHDHRRRGLAAFVVAHCTHGLLSEDRIPLYRHSLQNEGSAATADGLGFRPVARIDYFVAGA